MTQKCALSSASRPQCRRRFIVRNWTTHNRDQLHVNHHCIDDASRFLELSGQHARSHRGVTRSATTEAC